MRTHRTARRSDAGFSLAALIFFATAASIIMAAAVPAYQMQAKREMEEELIFRGEEYMRAILKYQRRFGIYPTSVDQLVSTNSLRFLRKPYVDPVTGKEFRLITIDPAGNITGSKLFMQPGSQQQLFGNTQIFGQQNQQQQAPQGQQRGFQASGQQQQQGVRGGQPGQGGFGGQPGQPFQGAPGQQQRGQQPSGPVSGISGISSGGGTPIAAGGIIGVASDSDQESLKVYNTRQKYDEWEFIAIMGGQAGQQQNPLQQNPFPNQNQNQQQNQNPFQNPNQQNPNLQNPPFGGGQNSPFPNNPGNPLGGPPATSPFGPAGGQRQNQNPLGFGAPMPQSPPPGR